jgi:hypothetical protein
MAQAITSWLISDGRFRVHAINAVGRRSARIIEIEDLDTGERFHGSARKLRRMFQSLGSSGVEVPSRPALLSRNQVPNALQGWIPMTGAAESLDDIRY